MISRCLLWNAALAAVGFSAFAADDKPAGPTLPQAIRTNLVGHHAFAPRWIGTSTVVYASGIFTKAEPPVIATNRYKLRFDTVVVTPKAAVGNVGPRGLARAERDGGYSALHTLRDELPGHVKLQSAKTLADLERLLGPVHGFRVAQHEGGEARERVSWAAATLKRDSTLDTVQVNAMIEKRDKARDAHIHSLEILRGKAAPEIKKAE